MDKYAELNKRAILYAACRGILRVKLAARMPTYEQMNAWTPEQVKANYDKFYAGANAKRQAWFDQRMKQQDYLDYVNGAAATGGGAAASSVAPTASDQPRSWGQFFQDSLDWGSQAMKDNGMLVTRDQQSVADKYNAQQAAEAQQALARGEYNGYDPSQQMSATSVSSKTVTKDPNAAKNNANGSGTGNITINNNMPQGSGGGGQGGGGQQQGAGQQYQSGPGLADYITQFQNYRNATA